MKKVLRIWWDLRELIDRERGKYRSTKLTSDYPNDMSPEAACSELWNKWGKLGRDDRGTLAPMRYADIKGWKLVKEYPLRGSIPCFTATELPFFPPELARASLMDSPNPKKKRKKG